MTRSLPRMSGRQIALVGLLALFAECAVAEEDMHAHHHHMAAAPQGVLRSEVGVSIPRVAMVRQDGAKVIFPDELDDGRPVILSFIYTTCTAICPVVSQVLAQTQERLAKNAEPVHLISVSIDPEHDTPAQLLDYAKRFNAGPQWQHYTGTVQSSITLQTAFGAYSGDKMNHTPVTFLRSAPGQRWVRLDGFASDNDLVAEYRRFAQIKSQ